MGYLIENMLYCPEFLEHSCILEMDSWEIISKCLDDNSFNFALLFNALPLNVQYNLLN